MTPAAAPISRGGQVSLSRLAHYQEYRRGGADPRYQGLFAPQNMRAPHTRARGIEIEYLQR